MYIHFLFQKDGREALLPAPRAAKASGQRAQTGMRRLRRRGDEVQPGRDVGTGREHGVPVRLVYPRHGLGQLAAWMALSFTHTGPEVSLRCVPRGPGMEQPTPTDSLLFGQSRPDPRPRYEHLRPPPVLDRLLTLRSPRDFLPV